MPPAAPAVVLRRRTGLVIVGVVLVVAAIVTTVALLLAASAAADRGVRDLARAPVGCTTTLQFEEGGSFIVYDETVGEIGALEGDCPNGSDEYLFEGSGTPQADLRLVDSSGDVVSLEAEDSKEYDANGSKGTSVASMRIATAGEYRLTVTSSDSNFAVAVGKDPNASADTLRTLGIVFGVLLLLAGIVLVVLGLRRRPAPATATAAVALPVTSSENTWAPTAPAPTQQM
ncbi:MAG: hypothetical protein WD023_02980, partial [Ilumatobacteraceae bacterium]